MKKNNSVIKLILFLLFFMLVLTLFLLIYIIPELKKYKSNKAVLKNYEELYYKELKIKEKLLSKKSALEKKYKKEITKYNTKFNEKNFKDFVKSSLKEATFTKIPSKTDTLQYEIQGEIKTNSELYKFIEKLNNYDNLVKIKFPLVYKVEENYIFLKLNVTILQN